VGMRHLDAEPWRRCLCADGEGFEGASEGAEGAIAPTTVACVLAVRDSKGHQKEPEAPLLLSSLPVRRR
jgi:hypothetical protein